MTTPQTKDEVLVAFQAARREHEAFLAAIPRALMTVPGATGSWTVKDVIAHVAAWRRRTLARLEALQRGEPAPPPPWGAELAGADDDAINAWIYAQTHDQPLDSVLADWSASFDRIAGLLAALPEADLFDPQRFPFLEGQALADAAGQGFLGHFREEHEPTLRAWLAAQAPGQH